MLSSGSRHREKPKTLIRFILLAVDASRGNRKKKRGHYKKKVFTEVENSSKRSPYAH
jgi:hypothetical protein